MAVTAFQAPWAPGYSIQELRNKLSKGYKRLTKKQLASANMGYSMSRGYYNKESDNWGPKPEKPSMRRVKLANGRYVSVATNDYGDGSVFDTGFDVKNDKELAEYIESTNYTYAIDGCGHIAKLEYSPRRNVMRVTFQPETEGNKTWGRDDVAIYFRVPTAVFGELYWLAESKATQASPVTGEERHALGIKFWDLVRIRHTVTGGRYPYTVSNIKPRAKRDKPVAEWKTRQDFAEDQLYGSGNAAEYDAVEEAMKKSVNKAKKEGAGSTGKDAAIIAECGNAENAAKLLDSYAATLPSTREKNNYAALNTLTDKYNYLLIHRQIDDWFTKEE